MRSGERGFTLIEMLVAVTLSGTVGAIATTAIVQGFHQQASSDARAAAVANVRTALQRTMRELREIEPDQSTLYPNALTMIEYQTNRTLSYSLQTTNGVTSLVVNDGSGNHTVVRNLVNDVNDPTQQIFTPIPAPGYAPAVPGSVDTHTCAIVGQTPTQYATKDCVGIITVHLRVMPTDASGKALCAPTGGCVIDVSDSADIRNNNS